jgi:zinc-ribbon domain
MATSTSSELICPSCGRRVEDADERFCPSCGLPLVAAEAQPLVPTARQELARKVKPQLAEGPLVRVAGAANQVEAEFIQALLLEEGVPSTTRRAAGFDVPDFLAAGPRDVLVASSGLDVARDVLLQADLQPVMATGDRGGPTSSMRLLLGLLCALAVVAAAAWAGTELLSL